MMNHKKSLTKKVNSDFFTYADNINSYWTGYYTTNPNLKSEIRYLGKYYEQISKLFVFTFMKDKSK